MKNVISWNIAMIILVGLTFYVVWNFQNHPTIALAITLVVAIIVVISVDAVSNAIYAVTALTGAIIALAVIGLYLVIDDSIFNYVLVNANHFTQKLAPIATFMILSLVGHFIVLAISKARADTINERAELVNDQAPAISKTATWISCVIEYWLIMVAIALSLRFS